MSRSRQDRQLSAVALLLILAGGCGESDPADAQAEDGREAGETAVWRLAPDQGLAPSSTTFTALVTRLECASGVTGEVLPPEISGTGTEIVITFSVARHDPQAADCQGNDEVPFEVSLDEPVGERALVDGACAAGGEAATTSFCTPDGVRHKP